MYTCTEINDNYTACLAGFWYSYSNSYEYYCVLTYEVCEEDKEQDDCGDEHQAGAPPRALVLQLLLQPVRVAVRAVAEVAAVVRRVVTRVVQQSCRRRVERYRLPVACK